MKIFHWVHKRFHNVSLKDGLARNVLKKAESVTNDADKQELLKQIALVNVFDGLEHYGLLTIGTLGFDDPSKTFRPQTEYVVLESKGDEDEEEFNDDIDDGQEEEQYEEDEKLDILNEIDEEVDPLIAKKHHLVNDAYTCKVNFDVVIDDYGVESSVDNESDIIGKKKGERTTLAQLFLADSEMKGYKNSDLMELIKSNNINNHTVHTNNDGKKNPNDCAKNDNGKSFAKEFLKLCVGKEDSCPMKKLQKMMRRVLKRKIHPELQGKVSKGDNPKKSVGIVEGLVSKAKFDPESVSLLQSPPGPFM